jgi:hypothetical protein
MSTELIRFFPNITYGQKYKQNWSAVYESDFPVSYRNELMEKCQLHAKDGILKEVFDLEAYDKLQVASQKEPLYCVDLLSAYGDSFLATLYGMSPEEIFSAWADEESSLNLPKPRRFACKTVGIDLSKSALNYGCRAGIFDETMAVNINQLSQSEAQQLSTTLGSAHFVHLGAPGYMDLEQFYFVIDAFAAGKGDGVLIVAFNYVFMKHHKEFKQYIIKKLKFINCVGGIQRYLLPKEQEYYKVSCAYSTTWVMERRNG